MDENDNLPTFENQNYQFMQKEEIDGTTMVGKLTSKDADSDDNAVMDYEIIRGDITK